MVVFVLFSKLQSLWRLISLILIKGMFGQTTIYFAYFLNCVLTIYFKFSDFPQSHQEK